MTSKNLFAKIVAGSCGLIMLTLVVGMTAPSAALAQATETSSSGAGSSNTTGSSANTMSGLVTIIAALNLMNQALPNLSTVDLPSFQNILTNIQTALGNLTGGSQEGTNAIGGKGPADLMPGTGVSYPGALGSAANPLSNGVDDTDAPSSNQETQSNPYGFEYDPSKAANNVDNQPN